MHILIFGTTSLISHHRRIKGIMNRTVVNITSTMDEDSVYSYEDTNDSFLLAREEELKKLNQELNSKLILEQNDDLQQDNEGDYDKSINVNVIKEEEEVETPLDTSDFLFESKPDDDTLLHNIKPAISKRKSSRNNNTSAMNTSEHGRNTRTKEQATVGVTKNKKTYRIDTSTSASESSSSSPPSSYDSSPVGADQVDDSFTSENRIGIKASLRIKNAKIKALENKLKETITQLQSAHDKTQKQTLLLSQKGKEILKLQTQKKEWQTKHEKLLGTYDKLKQDHTNQKQSIQEFQKENTSLVKQITQAQNQTKQREVRLHRAMDEISKIKQQLSQQTKSQNNTEKDSKILKELENKLKSCEKQKQEILLAFQKQLKLIHVLKKQKIHAEASRLLEFTEQEFLSVIDWDSNGEQD